MRVEQRLAVLGFRRAYGCYRRSADGGAAWPRSATKMSQETAVLEASEWPTHIHCRSERKLQSSSRACDTDRVYKPLRRSSGVDADLGSAPTGAAGDGDTVSAIVSRSSFALAFLDVAASYPRMALTF